MIKGFGGIFWRTKDLDVVKKWYSEVLKLEINNWNGTIIKTQSESETVFSFFDENDGYFPPEQQVMLNFQVHDLDENDGYFPPEQQVMLNFQVHDLDETIQHLEHMGVPFAKKKEISEFGKFIWIEDPEGRLIELWEK